MSEKIRDYLHCAIERLHNELEERRHSLQEILDWGATGSRAAIALQMEVTKRTHIMQWLQEELLKFGND